MLLSIAQAPTSQNDVLLVWYCRGCKRSVQAVCEPEAKAVNCPHCGVEKRRFSEEKK